MKKYIFICIIISYSFSIYSCTHSLKEQNINKETISKNEEYSSFDQLLLSSNFYIDNSIDRKTIHTEYDNTSNGIYTYRIYSVSEGTGTLGWVKYDARCKILYDITGDIRIIPKKLTFDSNKAIIFNESLNDIIETCPREEITNLPFDLRDWISWQDSIDRSIIVQDTAKYHYYSIKDNFRLNYYYNFQNDSGTTANNYFKIPSGSTYECYIIEIDNNEESVQYKMITINDDHIISEDLIGELKAYSRSVFAIGKDKRINILQQMVDEYELTSNNIIFIDGDSISLTIDNNGIIKKENR